LKSAVANPEIAETGRFAALLPHCGLNCPEFCP
jgi:hypothetical protein